MHRVWKRLVRAGNTSGVSLDVVISDDLQVLSHGELDWLAILELSSTDLWSFGVEHDSTSLVWALLESLFQVVDRCSVGLLERQI